MLSTPLCQCRCSKCVETQPGYALQSEDIRFKHQIRDETEGPYIPPCTFDTCVLLRGLCLQKLNGIGLKGYLFQCSLVKPIGATKHQGLDNYMHAHFGSKHDAARFYYYYHIKQYTLCSRLKDVAVLKEPNRKKTWHQINYDTSEWDNLASGTACRNNHDNTTNVTPGRVSETASPSTAESSEAPSLPQVMLPEPRTSPLPTTTTTTMVVLSSPPTITDDVAPPPLVKTEPTFNKIDNDQDIIAYYKSLIRKRDEIQEKIDALSPFIELVTKEQTN